MGAPVGGNELDHRELPNADGRMRKMNTDDVSSRLSSIDPGGHQFIKGLRLVAAYGIAMLLGAQFDPVHSASELKSLGTLAGGAALFAMVSEARAGRYEASRDLLWLTGGASLGAAVTALLGPAFAARLTA